MAKLFKYERLMNKLLDLLGGQLTRRVILIKGIVTCTLIAWYISPGAGTLIAIIGNLAWLWVAPENETKVIEQEVDRAVKDLRQQVADLHAKLEAKEG